MPETTTNEQTPSYVPLSNSRMRLKCAHVQFKTLKAEIQRWFEKQPYTFRVEGDANTGEQILKIDTVDSIPICWAVTAGDILHNFRSALDNAVHDLTVVHNGTSIKTSEFPIYNKRKLFLKESGRKIGGVHPQCRTFIESAQPFNYPEPPNALWVLHELNILDKHRTLPLVQEMMEISSTGDFKHSDSIKIGSFRIGQPARLKPNAEVARWKAIDVSAGGKMEVKMKITGSVTLEIRASIDPIDYPLIATLEKIGQVTENIITGLEKLV